jgi:hypothetical protein
MGEGDRMRSYTDFIVIVGNKEIEFRHSAQTVREFFELQNEIIFDYCESQWVRKSEIVSVRLDPRPFFVDYTVYRCSLPNPMTLNAWIHALGTEERERLLNIYHSKRGGLEVI